MNTPGNGSPGRGVTASSASKESRCRPYPLRRTVTSITPSGCWSARPSTTSRASTISPAHTASAGMPSQSASRSGVRSPDESSSLSTVVDSPPGSTIASTPASCVGRLDQRGGRAERLERLDLLAERALERDDADLHNPTPSLRREAFGDRASAPARPLCSTGRATSPRGFTNRGRRASPRAARSPRRASPRRDPATPSRRCRRRCSASWPRRSPGRASADRTT